MKEPNTKKKKLNSQGNNNFDYSTEPKNLRENEFITKDIERDNSKTKKANIIKKTGQLASTDNSYVSSLSKANSELMNTNLITNNTQITNNTTSIKNPQKTSLDILDWTKDDVANFLSKNNISGKFCFQGIGKTLIELTNQDLKEDFNMNFQERQELLELIKKEENKIEISVNISSLKVNSSIKIKVGSNKSSVLNSLCSHIYQEISEYYSDNSILVFKDVNSQKLSSEFSVYDYLKFIGRILFVEILDSTEIDKFDKQSKYSKGLDRKLNENFKSKITESENPIIPKTIDRYNNDVGYGYNLIEKKLDYNSQNTNLRENKIDKNDFGNDYNNNINTNQINTNFNTDNNEINQSKVQFQKYKKYELNQSTSIPKNQYQSNYDYGTNKEISNKEYNTVNSMTNIKKEQSNLVNSKNTLERSIKTNSFDYPDSKDSVYCNSLYVPHENPNPSQPRENKFLSTLSKENLHTGSSKTKYNLEELKINSKVGTIDRYSDNKEPIGGILYKPYSNIPYQNQTSSNENYGNFTNNNHQYVNKQYTIESPSRQDNIKDEKLGNERNYKQIVEKFDTNRLNNDLPKENNLYYINDKYKIEEPMQQNKYKDKNSNIREYLDNDNEYYRNYFQRTNNLEKDINSEVNSQDKTFKYKLSNFDFPNRQIKDGVDESNTKEFQSKHKELYSFNQQSTNRYSSPINSNNTNQLQNQSNQKAQSNIYLNQYNDQNHKINETPNYNKLTPNNFESLSDNNLNSLNAIGSARNAPYSIGKSVNKTNTLEEAFSQYRKDKQIDLDSYQFQHKIQINQNNQIIQNSDKESAMSKYQTYFRNQGLEPRNESSIEEYFNKKKQNINNNYAAEFNNLEVPNNEYYKFQNKRLASPERITKDDPNKNQYFKDKFYDNYIDKEKQHQMYKSSELNNLEKRVEFGRNFVNDNTHVLEPQGSIVNKYNDKLNEITSQGKINPNSNTQTSYSTKYKKEIISPNFSNYTTFTQEKLANMQKDQIKDTSVDNNKVHRKQRPDSAQPYRRN